MNTSEAIHNIKNAINNAPRNSYVAELHLQVIKYADVLGDVSGKEFCERIGIGLSYGVEYSKMRKIAGRLVSAGLDTSKI